MTKRDRAAHQSDQTVRENDRAAGNGHRATGKAGPDGGKRGRGGGKGDRVMVPPADFQSYYGRPVVKPPVWEHDVAGYLFTGGLAAGSALLAAGADLTGRPALRTTGRLTAVASLGVATYFLINDLGRPARFLNMLRVAKPTSPMSMGTWIFSAFSVAAGAAAASEATPWLPRGGAAGIAARALPAAGRVSGLASAALAPALATYTAVLLSNTATPSWHTAYPRLPFVFAGSALASGGAAGLIGAPTEQAGPARTLAVAGAALEMTAMHGVEHRMGLVSEPYRQGVAGRWLRAARMLTTAGAVGALFGARSRAVSAIAGLTLMAGSVCTRFGVFEAGKASAMDPKYTVLPQRERLAARGDA